MARFQDRPKRATIPPMLRRSRALAALSLAACASSASAATLTLTVSPDPTEEQQFTITATGSNETNRTIYTYISRYYTSCPTYAYEASGYTPLAPASGSGVSAGAFTKTLTYTPPDRGSYIVCAYLATSSSAAPAATATFSIAVRQPAATLHLSVSSDPSEEKPLTVTADGWTEANRTLYAYISRYYTSCPAYPYEASGYSILTAASGASVPPGSFTKAYAFTPTDQGTYTVCAYVAESPSDTPVATATIPITVRSPAASLALAVTDTGTRAFKLTATGQTEVPRTIYAYTSPYYTNCPSAPYQASGYTTLTAAGDSSLATGSFTKTFDVATSANGNYIICAYIAENASDTPIAIASTTATRTGSLTAATPAEVELGQVVPITLTGSTYGSLQLSAYVKPAGTPCAKSASRYDGSGAVTVLDSVRADGVPISASASFGPAPSGTYVVCAYGEGSGPALSASSQFVIKQDPAIFPILLGHGDDEHRDRLFIRWRRVTGKMKDHIMVYDQEPAAGTSPVWDGDLDDDEVRASTDGDLQKARITHLGYGTFWWRIRRTDGTSTVYGPVQRARVVPRPLSAASARATATLTLKRSSKKPGIARIAVVSSPLTKVRVQIQRGGRTLLRRSYTETVAGKRGITIRLSCARTGTTKFTVTMTDPYGKKLTRRGHWTLRESRCASLRADEDRKRQAAARRAAEKKAAAERRRQQNNDNGSGGGGSGGSVGCDGDPHATPYPQHPGQRDGDGDGCYGET